MDIQKERESFEQFCMNTFLMCPCSGHFEREQDDVEYYEDVDTHRLWHLWQLKAKAQEVLDQLDVNSILHDIDCYFDSGLSNTERTANNLLQSIYEKLGGEIKAQEQGHEHP